MKMKVAIPMTMLTILFYCVQKCCDSKLPSTDENFREVLRLWLLSNERFFVQPY